MHGGAWQCKMCNILDSSGCHLVKLLITFVDNWLVLAVLYATYPKKKTEVDVFG